MPSSIKSTTGLVGRVSEELDAEERPASLDAEAEFGGQEARLELERKLLRKLDMRMSILIVIYILNYVRLVFSVKIYSPQRVFLYRSIGITYRENCNIPRPITWLICYFSVARLKGFEADLHLEGQQFNTLLSILYVGYILMQIPS